MSDTDTLLCFETTLPQMSFKIRGGVGEISKSVFRAIIYASHAYCTFLLFWYVSKPERFKSDWGQKWKKNYARLTPVEIRGGAGEMPEWIFRARFMTTDIYFWMFAAGPSWRLEVKKQHTRKTWRPPDIRRADLISWQTQITNQRITPKSCEAMNPLLWLY